MGTLIGAVFLPLVGFIIASLLESFSSPSLSVSASGGSASAGTSSPVLSSVRVADTITGLTGTAGTTGVMSASRLLMLASFTPLAGLAALLTAAVSVSNPVYSAASLPNILTSIVTTPPSAELQWFTAVPGALARMLGLDAIGSSSGLLATAAPVLAGMDASGAGIAHAATGIATAGGDPWLP